jgi:glycine cleavage system H protein
MDGFSYINIFETKGIEYLVIIGFLLLLIPFSLILNKKARITHSIKQALGALTANILRVPQGVFFSRNHTWSFMNKNGTANVGLDDLLLHLTGEVKVRNLKNPGETIRKGEVMTEIDHDGKLLNISSPISGTVVKTNHLLHKNPGLLNADPFGKGWICQIKPTDWKADTESCFIAGSATDWSARELDRFKDFLSMTMKKHNPTASYAILQDGGELSDHSLAELPGELWQDFQKEFLNPTDGIG